MASPEVDRQKSGLSPRSVCFAGEITSDCAGKSVLVEAEVTPVCCACQVENTIGCASIVTTLDSLDAFENRLVKE